MDISLKQVRYFIAAADFGQISLAAMELNISQSAITAAIKQLETSLNVKLFQRNSHGVSLTTQGARFLQHARSIIAAVNEAIHLPLSDDTAMTGKIRIGVTYTVAGYFIPRYHARFARNYPGINVELVELSREAIEHQLLEGSLDAAVLLVSNLADHALLAHETLFRSRRRLWLPTEHSLLTKANVSLQDVVSEPYVMLSVDEADSTTRRYWLQAGLEPQISFETNSVEAVRSMVAAGMGVTILSDMVYRPWSLEGQRLETVKLKEDIPTMDVGLAWLRDKPAQPAVRTFMSFLNQSFGNARQGEVM